MRLSTELYTPHVVESKQFYCSLFNFRVKTEMEGFVVLQHAAQTEYEIMFCVPNSPFVNEIFHPPFSGQGIIFQIEVAHVADEYERLRSLGVPIALDLVEEPVNGKHFTVVDPNGLYIDVVEFS